MKIARTRVEKDFEDFMDDARDELNLALSYGLNKDYCFAEECLLKVTKTCMQAAASLGWLDGNHYGSR